MQNLRMQRVSEEKKISKKEIRLIIRVHDFRYSVNFNYGSHCSNRFDDFLWQFNMILIFFYKDPTLFVFFKDSWYMIRY